MPSFTTEESKERLATAAVEWNASRLRARELRRLRASEPCENEAEYERETNSPAIPPCWRTRVYVYPDSDDPLPRDQWCGPCVRRQAIHEQYRAEMKRRGVLMRRVERLASRAALESETGSSS